MKYPFMPLFLGDLLADTLHLSTQEFGAYMLLILHAWKHEAMVPCAKAQQIARVNNYHWPRVKRVIEPFCEVREVRCGTSDVLHRMYYIRRVHQELTSADEISNKRKGAALQMHENRRANASVLHMHPQSHPLIESSNGKGREAPEGRVVLPPVVNYRDPGVEYRSPPKKKSAPPLQPLPEKLR